MRFQNLFPLRCSREICKRPNTIYINDDYLSDVEKYYLAFYRNTAMNLVELCIVFLLANIDMGGLNEFNQFQYMLDVCNLINVF